MVGDATPVAAQDGMRFGTYSYILSFGLLNAVVVSAMLAWTRANAAANRLLAAMLLVFALRLVPYIIGYAGAYDAYPWLSFAPFDLPLLVGPLLWLHVERLTSGRMPSRWALHLLPGLVHTVATSAVFLFAGQSRKDWIALHIVDPYVAPFVTFASLATLALYAWKAIRRMHAYQQWLDAHLSSREEYRLRWLAILVTAFALTGVVLLIVAVVDAFIRPLSYIDEFPVYVFQAVMAWVLGLFALRHASTVYPQPTSHASPPSMPEPDAQAISGAVVATAESSGAPDSRREPDWAALGARYLAEMREQRWAADPQLTLASLARHLGTNTNYLSRALNQGLGQTFNECINRQRVDAVAAELRRGSTRDLVQIGYDAGFNSKASFQRAFVTYMKCTPSAYREAQKGQSA